jgi:hypothetical protein
VRFIWMIEDKMPLSAGACTLGVHLLAERVGADVPDDAVVMLGSLGLLGGYPLSRFISADNSVIWLADYEVLAEILGGVAEERLRAAKVPVADSFERNAKRFFHRRFLHWPEQHLTELDDSLPSLRELMAVTDEFHDEHHH